MRSTLIALMGVTVFLGNSVSVGQESEVNAPKVVVSFVIAELGSDGNMTFDLGVGSPAIPRTESVVQTYTVMVPYTEEVEQDGKKIKVIRTRQETKTRTVPVTRMTRAPSPVFKIDDLKFSRIDGVEVAMEDAQELFESKRPVVLVPAGQELDEYYRAVLRDDVLIVQLPVVEPSKK